MFMIRYATVGTSWITDSFISGCGLLGDKFELAAVYSRNPDTGEAFAKAHGCEKVYTSLSRLAADKSIDAVYIASPNAFHTEQSEIMLNSGKHVICEKPIAVDPQELDRLQRLAFSKGLVYIEAIMYRHLPAREIIKEKIKELGRISMIRFDFCQRSKRYDGLMAGVHQNIFDPKMAAGALMDIGIYCVYPCIDFFGIPDKIHSGCRKLYTGIDGEGFSVFEYGDKTAVLTYSKTGEGAAGSEIIGENGTLYLPTISKFNGARFVSKDGTETVLTEELSKSELMSFEALDFYRYITKPEKYSDNYKNVSALALEICKTLKEIRDKADIKFDI